MNNSFTIEGQIVDLVNSRVYPGVVVIEAGKITKIKEQPVDNTQYIMPGFVDAHVHIESSMLVPSEFARLAVCHGTVATVSDPHEIANVLGKNGIRYMIENGRKVPFKFFFGAPSCVPSTAFETAGATLDADDIEELLASDDIYYLSEVMNYPGVINEDPELMRKIAAAKKHGKPIDGHAPAVTGDNLQKYVSAGITTDHECFRLAGALEKISLGMKILIREGSAARNFEALIPLMATHPDRLMFCSDDKHPDELDDVHIDVLVRKAIALGYDVMDVLRAASLNAIRHYKLNVGLLQLGDDADFIVVDDLRHPVAKQTYIRGMLVAENGVSNINYKETLIPNIFKAEYIHAAYVQDVFSGGVPAAHHLVDQIPPIRLHQHDICSGVVCSETVRLRTVALAWAHHETDFIILAFEGKHGICILFGLVIEHTVPKGEPVRVGMDGDVEGFPVLIIVYLRLVLSRLDGLEAADEFYLRPGIQGKEDRHEG